jgi:drug/metabolite transporter (DMT)-like permease
LRSRLKNHSAAPHLALIAVQLMFGTWPIVGKVALRVISTTGLVAFRVAGAAIAFVLIQRNLGQLRRMPRRDLLTLLLCSLLGVGVNQFLYLKGLSLSTVTDVTLLTTAIPVFTLVISVLLGYDRLSLRRTFGILLSAIGVIYLVDPLRADFSSRTSIGNLLIVGSTLSYAAYIALSKDLFQRYGALNMIMWIFVLACIVTTPVGLIAARGNQLRAGSELHGDNAVAWLAIAYTILVPTVAAYYLNAWALTRVVPSTVATYVYLQPLIAFGLAPLVLGERWNARTLIACILIFAGVAIVTRRGRSQAIKEVAKHPDALAH